MKEVITLLKNRDFMHLWVSQIISQVVVNTLSFLLLIYLFERTGSTIATSIIWIAYALPAVLFGPVAAVAADLFDKRKILTISILSQAVVVAIFAVLHARFLYLAYGIVFAYSAANQFYIPAEAASLPILVKKKNLPFANSLFFTTVQLSIALGFLFAGLSYEYVGLGRSMAASTVLLLLAFSAVSLLPKLRPLEHIPKDLSGGVASFFAELIEGYQFIRDTKRVFLPFLLLVGLQVSLSVIVVTLPVLAQDLVKIKPSLAGIAIVAPGALGAFGSMAIVSKAIARGVSRKRVIVTSLFFLSVSLIFLGAVVPNLYFWLGRTLSVVCFFVAGAAYVGILIPTLTHLQLSTPKGKLGRVFGNIWIITTAATVVPVMFSATIIEVFGVSLLLSLLGILGLVGFFATEIVVPGAFRARVGELFRRRTDAS